MPTTYSLLKTNRLLVSCKGEGHAVRRRFFLNQGSVSGRKHRRPFTHGIDAGCGLDKIRTGELSGNRPKLFCCIGFEGNAERLAECDQALLFLLEVNACDAAKLLLPDAAGFELFGKKSRKLFKGLSFPAADSGGIAPGDQQKCPGERRVSALF